ncbi:MAG TPA: hypothetical protein ENN58_04325, partial [bacterium]|nr:hypothetical protein [bacterium]
MITIKNMVMIGATEKHAGKTTFTTKLIKKLKNKYPGNIFVGIKITILREGLHNVNGFSVTEEKYPEKLKDTAKMFKAGADKVLWLRSDEYNIEKGIEALLNE